MNHLRDINQTLITISELFLNWFVETNRLEEPVYENILYFIIIIEL